MKEKTYFSFFLFFLFTALLYVLSLLFLRYDLNPPSIVIVLPIIVMICTIIYQIIKKTNDERYILFEIVIFSVLIHLIYVIPCIYGAYGDDFPQYYYATKLGLQYGFPIPVFYTLQYPQISDLIYQLSYFPTFLLGGGIIQLICGIDLITACKWIPVIWVGSGTLAIYLIGKSFFSDNRVGILSALVVATLPWSIVFHSQFVRESYAYVIMLFLIYFFYTYYKKRKFEILILLILFCLSLILSHYYVSIFWVVFILLFFTCYLFITVLQEKIFKEKIMIFKKYEGNLNNIFLVICFIVIFTIAYWTYMQYFVFSGITSIADLVSQKGMVTLPFSSIAETVSTKYLKDIILYQVARFLFLAFCIILLIEVINGVRGKCSFLKEDFLTASWVGIFFVVLPFALLLRSTQLHATRVVFFAYFLMIIGVVHVYFSSKKLIVRKIILFLLIAFCIANILQLSIAAGNPLAEMTTFNIISWNNKEIVYSDYFMPQTVAGIKATDFYAISKDASFVQLFHVNNSIVYAEALEDNSPKIYDTRPFTDVYVINKLVSYSSSNLVYNSDSIRIFEK